MAMAETGVEEADARRAERVARCYAHTDLEWRLANVPADATCRGAFFNMLDDRARSLGALVHDEYSAVFRITRFVPFKMISVADYLTRVVVLAAISAGDEHVYAGVRELQRSAFDAWASTLLGRAALAVVDPTLPGILRMLERTYASRTVVSHTRFEILSVRPDAIETRFTDEFVYIEHAMVGALEGVAGICGEKVRVEAELESPFRGIVRVHR